MLCFECPASEMGLDRESAYKGCWLLGGGFPKFSPRSQLKDALCSPFIAKLQEGSALLASGDLSAFVAAAPKITAPNSRPGRTFASSAMGQLLPEQLRHTLELAHTFPTSVLSLASLRNNTLVLFIPLPVYSSWLCRSSWLLSQSPASCSRLLR